jgi:hypothetical protein
MEARNWISLFSALAALLAVLAPFVIDLITRISWRRIWAIARLSWTEAVRKGVFWVFGIFGILFLFMEWFLPTTKPEDQIRDYVSVIYLAIALLFLIATGLLGAFSIPGDLRRSSIHTVVTKPVEKFEIVLGRFVGYGAILTVGMAVVSGISLIYLWRGVNDDAQYESYKARVVRYGDLHFVGTKNANKGMMAGREWDYRTYITNPTRNRNENLRQYAVWDFAAIPASVLGQSEPVHFEYTFDIFRLSKGEQDKGIFCTFTFADVSNFASSDPYRQSIELEKRADLLKKKRTKEQKGMQAQQKGSSEKGNEALETLEVKLIEEFRIFQVPSQEVSDQHTQVFTIPAKYFKALVSSDGMPRRDADKPMPALRVFVSGDLANHSQLVGVSKQDFYLLEGEKPFWQNFLKGVLGLWCVCVWVLGVSLALSTYLGDIISLLIAIFLLGAGTCVDYLREIAEQRAYGGGPMQSLTRITTRMPIAKPLEESPTTSVILAFDTTFSWWIDLLTNLIPDLRRHDLEKYVANGFDITWINVLLLDNALPLLGELIRWAVTAYYLMKFREIANPG